MTEEQQVKLMLEDRDRALRLQCLKLALEHNDSGFTTEQFAEDCYRFVIKND